MCSRRAHLTDLDTGKTRSKHCISQPKRVEKVQKEERFHRSGVHRYTGQISEKNPRYRESQEAQGWTEERCAEYDALAQEDHSYSLTTAEYLRHASNWKIQLNSSGPNGPMAKRSDYQETVQLKASTTPRIRRNPGRAHPLRRTKVEQILTTSSQRHVKTVLVWTREQDGSIILHLPHLHLGNILTNGGTRTSGTAEVSNEFRIATFSIFLSQVSFTYSR